MNYHFSLINLFAEQNNSPLGQMVSPIDSDIEINNISLPKGASIKTCIQLEINKKESYAIIYDLNPNPPEYNPHIAIIDNGQITTQFNLSKYDEYSEGYIYIEGNKIKINDNIIGAGTIFVIISKYKGMWNISFMQRCSQARLTIEENGQIIHLLSANNQDHMECTWCPHIYNKRTFIYNMETGNYILKDKYILSQKINPMDVVKNILEFK